MYGKTEAANLTREFWAAFGTYLKPVLNADGEKINWTNYKTGVKHIYFRMDVTKWSARVGIELQHPDREKRDAAFEKMISLKPIFEEWVSGKWTWLPETYDDDGTNISRVMIQVDHVNIFKKDDWPAIISFLKEHMLSLDKFWSVAREGFEA